MYHRYSKKISKLENVKIEENALNEIVRLSDGCMRDALSILDQVIAFSSEEIKEEDVHEINGTIPQLELKNFIHSILEQDYKNAFELIDTFDKKGKSFIKLTEEIILFLRNILLLINVPDYFKTLNYDLDIYNDIAKQFDTKLVFQYLNNFNNIIPEMKKTNHARIIFEMALIEIIQTKNEKIDIKKVEIEDNIKPEEKTEPIREIPVKKENNISQKNTSFDTKLLKEIRVNNTLCNFNKNEFKIFKDRIDEIRSLIINPDYSEYASMVIDGDLRALGNENMIFVFSNERDSNQFNENIIKIDKMLKDYFDKTYKTIAVTKEEWETIKTEFNSKKRQYTYMEEPKIIDESKEEKDELEEMFGEIIEYL